MNDVAEKVATLKNQIEQLGMTVDELLDFPEVAKRAALPEEVIRRLFAGEAVAAEEIDLPFSERLQYLLPTKLREDGKRYTQGQIADYVGVTVATIQNLLRGTRKPGLDVASKLETFFDVPAGRLSRDGSDALVSALDRTVEGVMLMAELKGIELTNLSLRGGSPLVGDDALAKAVRSALDEAEAQRRAAPTEILEAREIGEEMRRIPEAERTSFKDMVMHSAKMWRRRGN
ncbi:helix-turn-helix domain-containing protein [Streptomyces sp. NBC_01433]|uniref:helix-turn-helix domain-containing protein n=1 Tax=Streptomyces sp. NBC_01433 TaxID=2903864 RepID=UPI00224E4152|nr:helix-turn-helix transcriptional regulator [Streptomyces sp. NBC_01433]MCX4682131.1 helix-turn-helix domain-containing protein [Streptomyces sp. NBC_01433]